MAHFEASLAESQGVSNGVVFGFDSQLNCSSVPVAELSCRQGPTEGTCWGFVAASQCGLQWTSALKTDLI